MKVYISGKIGEEVLNDATREKFARAEDMLRLMGHDVFNPTTSGLGEVADQKENFAHCMGMHTTWYAEILKLDIRELSFCDAIFLLPDHEDSPGAAVELAYAKAVGIRPLFADIIQARNYLAAEFWKKVEREDYSDIDMKAPCNEGLDAYIESNVSNVWLPL